MDRLREIEIAVLREVIDAVDARLDTIAHLTVPRSKVYASVIYAVLSSARSTGHYGAGMLANAPLLDSILSGAEGTDHGATIFATLVDLNALN
ncbi:hypothetical protein [Nocardia cyriacigeorgica]|uniref:hypothetical protein n=1 Tax=Nocardia cyriacigeorgica TaxID=135487 RepID=UPI00030CCFAC|nr:hypothetical protein [Nocardia cyriacigeorgica]AVH23569.1 hypothetical protein C5B73_21195 [Nocardia cyriacigeorgica]MBF6323163.1 hypothetical protein [Nocardia cyriacigeorgica]PPJ15598.1 hypothetical protein C5E43_05360 [Nocardia cyriacigeorgica]TLF55765.1 hypothetical protein FEK31_19400 [Nocardia cyriacigeorgica]